MNYDDLNRPIEELCLSIRSINRLRKGKVFTIRDLVVLTAKQLVERTKISEASFQELTDELDSLGLSLGMTINGERAILASSPNSTEYHPLRDSRPNARGHVARRLFSKRRPLNRHS